jgi:hypothetical protein
VEPLFPVVPPYIFLDEPLRVGKARDDIKEVDAVPSHIALPLRFIPFIVHYQLYVQIVCTIKPCSSYNPWRSPTSAPSATGKMPPPSLAVLLSVDLGWVVYLCAADNVWALKDGLMFRVPPWPQPQPV